MRVNACVRACVSVCVRAGSVVVRGLTSTLRLQLRRRCRGLGPLGCRIMGPCAPRLGRGCGRRAARPPALAPPRPRFRDGAGARGLRAEREREPQFCAADGGALP